MSGPRDNWLQLVKKAQGLGALIPADLWLPLGSLLEMWCFLEGHKLPKEFWLGTAQKDGKVQLELSPRELETLFTNLESFILNLTEQDVEGYTFYSAPHWPQEDVTPFEVIFEDYLLQAEKQEARSFAYFYRPDLEESRSYRLNRAAIFAEVEPRSVLHEVFHLMTSSGGAPQLYRFLKYLDDKMEELEPEELRNLLRKKVGARWRQFSLMLAYQRGATGSIWPSRLAKSDSLEFTAEYFASVRTGHYPDLLVFWRRDV